MTSSGLTGCGVMSPTFNLPTGLAFGNGYAYVANAGNDTVSRCSITAAGNITDCQFSSGGFSVPNSITINDASTYAYVTNGGTSTVSKCSIDATDLSACSSTAGFNAPRDVVLLENFAYVANRDGNNVLRCTVDASTGVLSGCASAAGGFNKPMDLGISSSGNLLYVTNFEGASISLCSISALGALSGCAVTSTGFSGPRDIALTADGQYAYVTNFNSNNVARCDVLSDGTLFNCAVSVSGIPQATVIVIRTAG